MKKPLRRLALALTLLGASWLPSAANDADVNSAAATVLGQNLRESYNTLLEVGLELDEARFLELVGRVFRGETLDSLSREGAEELIRRAAGVASGATTRPDVLPPMDEAAENAWVAEKASLPRAEVLAGGVVLQRLTEGSGDKPGALDEVMVNYTGRLSSGQVFDVTEEPFKLPLYSVMPGLRTAMLQMRMGGTYRVFIPPAQAYGRESVMDIIPANSALDFTVEPLNLVER